MPPTPPGSTLPGKIRPRLLLLLAVLGGGAAAAGSLTAWPAHLVLLLLSLAGAWLSAGWALLLGVGLAGVAALAWQGALPGLAAPAWSAPAGGLWLLGLAVLPRLISELLRPVHVAQRQLAEQERLLQQQAELHPLTGLPGRGLAGMVLGMLQAEYHRSGGQGAAMAVTITDLHVARQVYDGEEVSNIIRRVHEALRGELRASDWIFQLTDDRFLVLANVGDEAQGHLVMAQRVAQRLARVQRVTLQTQVTLLPEGAELAPTLERLLSQPPLAAAPRPLSEPSP